MTLFCTRWLPWPSSWCVVRLSIFPTVPHLGSPHCGLRDCVWVASPASAVTSGVWCSLMACLFCSSESTMPSSEEGGGWSVLMLVQFRLGLLLFVLWCSVPAAGGLLCGMDEKSTSAGGSCAGGSVSFPVSPIAAAPDVGGHCAVLGSCQAGGGVHGWLEGCHWSFGGPLWCCCGAVWVLASRLPVLGRPLRC